MTLPRRVRLAAGLAFAGFFTWLVVRGIEVAEFERAFAGAAPSWIAAGLLAFAAGYACRVERWRVMLRRSNAALRWLDCAGPLLGSFAANNVLPFRAGDIMRALAFDGRLRVESGVVAGTLFVERLLDLVSLLLLLAVALAITGLDVHRLMGIGSAALMAAAAVILVLLLRPGLLRPIAAGGVTLALRVTPGRGEKLRMAMERCMTTLARLAKGDTMWRLVAWSAAAWLSEGCVFWFTALALSSIEAPAAGWIALPVGTLATLVPGTPGYVGTFDYFTVRAMCALGNATAPATAYALLVHALLWLPPTLIGGAYLLLHRARGIPRLKAP